MIKTVKFISILVTLCMLTTGCASMINGERQVITVKSSPSDAKVFMNNQFVGRTPLTQQFKRKSPAKRVEVKLEGYQTSTKVISKKWNPVTLVNVLTGFGFLFGFVMDYFTGAFYQFDPDNIQVNLEPKKESVK